MNRSAFSGVFSINGSLSRLFVLCLLVCLLVGPSTYIGFNDSAVSAQVAGQGGAQGRFSLVPLKFDTQVPPNYSTSSVGDGFVAYLPANSRFQASSPASGAPNQSILEFAETARLDIAINANFYTDLSTGGSPGCLGFCGSTGKIIANKSSSSSRYAFIVHQDANLSSLGNRIIARDSRVAILDYADVAGEQGTLNVISAKLNADPKIESVVSGNSLAALNGAYQSQTESFSGMNDASSRTLIGYTSTGQIVFAVFKTAAFKSRIKSFIQNSTPKITQAIMLDGGGSSQLYYRAGIDTLSGLSGYSADSFNSTHNLGSSGERVDSGTTGLANSAAAKQIYAPLFGRPGQQGLRNVPAYIGAVLSTESVVPPVVSTPVVPPVQPPGQPPTTDPLPPVLSSTSTYTLSPGWNAIALNVSAPDVTKASDLAAVLAEAGADVEVISRMESSSYKSFIPAAEGISEGIGDFNLVEGTGLFLKLKNLTPIEFKLTGLPISPLISTSIVESGIKFVGNMQGSAQQVAKSAVSPANAQTVIRSISSYEQGQFNSLVFDEDLVFGNDFQLTPTKAYFIVIKPI